MEALSPVLEAILKALQGCLPSAVRVGDTLRLVEPGGSVRLVVPRAAHDPQIDHGLVFGFCPPLAEGVTLEACHLRARCRRSVEAIEAAQALAQGSDSEANATRLAVEAARQIGESWTPFLRPQAWQGPGIEDMLRASANAAPSEVEPLVAALRAAALHALGDRTEARRWLEVAGKATDPRVRGALGLVRARLADA